MKTRFCRIAFWACFLFSLRLEAGLPERTEALTYDIQVFNILRALDLRLGIEPTTEENLFAAHLDLKPVGVLRFLVPYKRLQVFSKLRYLPKENRLRPEYYEKQVVTQKRIYRGVYQYDYQRGIVKGQGFFDGEALAPEEFPLPQKPGVYYDDLLSFVYNFRIGAYGRLNPGEMVQIHTIPTKNRGSFTLEVLPQSLWSEFSPVPGAAQLMELHVNREFLGFRVSSFFLWLSEDALPLCGVARNVVGWGDIVSVLRQPNLLLSKS